MAGDASIPHHYEATFAEHSLRTSAQAGLVDHTAERSSAGVLQADDANALGCHCLQFLVKLEVGHRINESSRYSVICNQAFGTVPKDLGSHAALSTGLAKGLRFIG